MALGLLFVLSVLVRGWLAHETALPSLYPDEFIYGNVARSVADGIGATWRGEGQGIPLLYPYLISPAFHISSPTGAYSAAKLIGVVVASLTIVPVWLLAREFVGPRLAIVPATLTAGFPGMLYTQQLVSENLALPIATCAIAAAVMALRRPRSRWIWVALAFSAAGAYTRVRLYALPFAILAALLLDVLRQPAGARSERLRLHRRPVLILVGALVIGALYLLISGHSTIGRYEIFPHGATVGGVLKGFWRHLLLAALASGVVPFACLLALVARPANWRDPDAGPLLCVAVPTILGISLLAGWFIEANNLFWPVERYVVYLPPVMFLGMALAAGRVTRRAGIAAALVTALALLTLPKVIQVLEQASLYGSSQLVGGLTSAFDRDHHPSLGIALLALPILCGAMLLIARRGRQTGLLAAGGLVLAVMVGQAWALDHKHIGFLHHSRDRLPAHLDWVDRATDKPVAIVLQNKSAGYENLSGFDPKRADWITEFFNRRVEEFYATEQLAPQINGGFCPWAYNGDGTLLKTASDCHAIPRVLLLAKSPDVTRFRGERQLADHGESGRLVELPTGAPHLLSFAHDPCFGTVCGDVLQIVLFLERPGRLEVRLAGRGGTYEVQTPTGNIRVGPYETRVVSARARAGVQPYEYPLQGIAPFPDVQAYAIQDGVRTRIL